MVRVTSLRRVDIAVVFPELVPLARKTARLHPAWVSRPSTKIMRQSAKII
ncbi:hypothetical protein [Kitasatospora sp. NPDC047058]